MAGIRL